MLSLDQDNPFTVGNVAEGMILHVIEEEVRKPPFITWVSKEQVCWGRGVHFGKWGHVYAEGLYKHSGVSRPSHADLGYQKQRWGYCMVWPPRDIWDIPNHTVRNHFVKKMIQGRDYTDVGFFWGLGYIDSKTSKLDLSCTSGISGWFMFSKDEESYPVAQEWLTTQEEWLQVQWIRNCDTYFKSIQQQSESGRKKALINQSLLASQTQWQKFKVSVDPKLLTWRKEED